MNSFLREKNVKINDSLGSSNIKRKLRPSNVIGAKTLGKTVDNHSNQTLLQPLIDLQDTLKKDFR